MICIKCDSAIEREEDGEVLLFEHGLEGNAKISLLNKTAYAIWDLCDGNNSIEDIIKIFASKFTELDVQKIGEDIKRFVDRMIERGWLIPVSDDCNLSI